MPSDLPAFALNLYHARYASMQGTFVDCVGKMRSSRWVKDGLPDGHLVPSDRVNEQLTRIPTVGQRGLCEQGTTKQSFRRRIVGLQPLRSFVVSFSTEILPCRYRTSVYYQASLRPGAFRAKVWFDRAGRLWRKHQTTSRQL